MNLLIAAGRALYGDAGDPGAEDWRLICDDLRLNERTVRRFLKPDAVLPLTLMREIDAMLRDRRGRLPDVDAMLIVLGREIDKVKAAA